MVCEEVAPGVIVCGPPRGVYTRMMRDCPECKRRHRFLERWDGAWYGVTFLGSCGDIWQDGELGYRPFAKGWRKKAQDKFRAMWDNAAPKDLYERYIEADSRFAMADGDEWERACADRTAALTAIHARTVKEN